MSNYNSAPETIKHILTVSKLIHKIISVLTCRALFHDASKLLSPEKVGFDEYTLKLKDIPYGTEEYNSYLDKLKEILKHHYEKNSHHPEHYPDGVDDMDLVDIVEMFCDWKASTERTKGGDIQKSIIINQKRFKLSEQLVKIFQNTANRYF